jgi:hypothetical protein
VARPAAALSLREGPEHGMQTARGACTLGVISLSVSVSDLCVDGDMVAFWLPKRHPGKASHTERTAAALLPPLIDKW